jgi:hypothetical protein
MPHRTDTMTARPIDAPLRITGLLPRPNDGSLGTRSWKDAGIRIRCASIAPHLGALGAAVKLVESQNLDRRIADGSYFDADVFMIYQTLEDHRPIVGSLLDAGKCVVVDVCDDLTRYKGVLNYNWENAQRAFAITVPTASLARRLAARVEGKRIYIVPDAVEGEPAPVRPPRREGPLRLFWYGWQHKLRTLSERLPALAELAARRPLELTIMSNLRPVGPILQSIVECRYVRLSIAAVPWDLSAFNAAMERSDIAVIPYNESISYSGRSPVRLIQAAWRGRLPVSEDVEGYPEFARFGVLHRSIVDGIAWAVENPDAAAGQLAALQRHVAETHRPEVLARTWMHALSHAYAGFREQRG